MNTDLFFQKIRTYHAISQEAELAWTKILRPRSYKKGECFITEGQHPKEVAFVIKGLFSQNYTSDNGQVVIKNFFPELRLAASVSAMLSNTPSKYTFVAIENCTVLIYDFFEFKKLVDAHSDIARFYIKYMEVHWIIEKEPLEISLRHYDAKTKYGEFVQKFPQLIKRLKKHHIASYLGITPTQLSRILLANK